MLWLIFALIAAIADGIKSVIHRFVMKTESIYSYALIENILTAIAFLPLVFFEFALPREPVAWAILLLSSLLWVAIALTGNAAYKYTQVSLKEPISQSRIIFVFLLSAVLLSEAITPEKILGTILIFAGLIIITYHKRKIFRRLSDKGVQITILSAILASFVAILDKSAMNYFTPGVYGFLVYLVPGIILLSIVGKSPETGNLIKTKGKYVLAVVALGVIAYYSILKAYTMADAGIVFPIIRLSSVAAVLCGLIVFREERKEMLKKIISLAVIMIGVILISGYYTLL